MENSNILDNEIKWLIYGNNEEIKFDGFGNLIDMLLIKFKHIEKPIIYSLGRISQAIFDNNYPDDFIKNGILRLINDEQIERLKTLNKKYNFIEYANKINDEIKQIKLDIIKNLIEKKNYNYNSFKKPYIKNEFLKYFKKELSNINIILPPEYNIMNLINFYYYGEINIISNEDLNWLYYGDSIVTREPYYSHNIKFKNIIEKLSVNFSINEIIFFMIKKINSGKVNMDYLHEYHINRLYELNKKYGLIHHFHYKISESKQTMKNYNLFEKQLINLIDMS